MLTAPHLGFEIADEAAPTVYAELNACEQEIRTLSLLPGKLGSPLLVKLSYCHPFGAAQDTRSCYTQYVSV